MSKILIVDDSKDILEALQFFLEPKGYEVKCIASASNLKQEITSFCPDLLFLDIFLNGFDGRKICKELRGHIDTKYLCIILFSASEKEVRKYKEYGADSYLEKPFGLTELIDTIENTLSYCKDHYSHLY